MRKLLGKIKRRKHRAPHEAVIVDKKLRRTLFWIVPCVIALALAVGLRKRRNEVTLAEQRGYPTKKLIAQTLQPYLEVGVFPEEMEMDLGAGPAPIGVSYTLDFDLQDHMEKLLKSYKPDYGAFVALSGNTGKILSLLSYTRNRSELGNLALKSYFPAASVFKIVTAAAALDRGKVTPDTVIPFNGGYHTLYRRNVTTDKQNRWTRHITLREAFAKSINTVFAKLGIYMLDYSSLKEYAERFQFNHPIDTEIPLQAGTFVVSDGNSWALAEAASGFNRIATLSPVQGALMAAAVANDGILMAPYLVDSLSSRTDSQIYRAEPRVASVAMTPEGASELRGMMRETVSRGTSRTAFRGFFRKKGFNELEVGGKTGSLQGTLPKGKCDWFVGYALDGEEIIAFAALTVNEENWRIKSSQLSRFFLEKYFNTKRSNELISRQ